MMFQWRKNNKFPLSCRRLSALDPIASQLETYCVQQGYTLCKNKSASKIDFFGISLSIRASVRAQKLNSAMSDLLSFFPFRGIPVRVIIVLHAKFLP